MALSFSAYAADKAKEPIKTVALIEARELPIEFDISFGMWRHFVPFSVAGTANGNGSAFIAQAMPNFGLKTMTLVGSSIAPWSKP